ncbi:MAG: DUF4390 domain-containing protein [Gemmatimonadota bacterium]
MIRAACRMEDCAAATRIAAACRFARGIALAAAVALAAWAAPGSASDRIVVTSAELQASPDADGGVVLNAQFDFDLPPVLEDAVNRGIALYFVIDFELYRERWYWFDRKLASESLTYRLTYSPLTRQYRLARDALAQPFDTLAEALGTLRRVRNWKVLERGTIKPDEDYRAQVRMRLDTSQLPRPFQINALTQRDWTLASDWRNVPVSADLGR